MKLVGERRALAAIVLAFWFLNFALNALIGPSPTAAMMWALAGVYGVAFFGVVAGYFWARWYAVGVSLFGVILGAIGLWMVGVDETTLILGGSHLLVTIMLWGSAMSDAYDGRLEWREKLHMDENAVHRLGRSVIRAGMSLPFVLVYGLAPRQSAFALVAAVAATLGFAALVRLRSWSILALGGAGALAVTLGGIDMFASDNDAIEPLLGGSLLLFATVPFLRPLLRARRTARPV
jgi:hypothetical protein